MPTYDYRCTECELVAEARHGINDRPQLQCPDCGTPKMKKMVSACGFSVKNTHLKGHLKDNCKANTEMRQDLLENHGIENVTPVGAKDLSQVYKEVKAAGDSVKDQMQAEKAKGAEKSRNKMREWKRKAQPRADGRGPHVLGRSGEPPVLRRRRREPGGPQYADQRCPGDFAGRRQRQDR